MVATMLSRMTLAEKVGQMTQAEIQSITLPKCASITSVRC